MLTDVFPLAGLRLTTSLVELRYPGDEELTALGELAAKGIHDPAQQPFAVEWTDQPADQIPLAVLQFQWLARARLSAKDWNLEFAVYRDGEPAGMQGIGARDFAVRREVATGSWLGQDFQGQGIGTHMRAAVLALAFEGLDAAFATSAAYSDNAASRAVSRKLGYQVDGVDRDVIRGRVQVSHRLRLSREAWEESQVRREIPVEIHGLDECRAMLGA